MTIPTVFVNVAQVLRVLTSQQEAFVMQQIVNVDAQRMLRLAMKAKHVHKENVSVFTKICYNKTFILLETLNSQCSYAFLTTKSKQF